MISDEEGHTQIWDIDTRQFLHGTIPSLQQLALDVARQHSIPSMRNLSSSLEALFQPPFYLKS